METWTWGHGDGDFETWRHRHGDMDMEICTRRYGHGVMDMEIWIWKHGHGDMELKDSRILTVYEKNQTENRSPDDFPLIRLLFAHCAKGSL